MQALKTNFLIVCDISGSCQVAINGVRMNLGFPLGSPHNAGTMSWICSCIYWFHIWHMTYTWVQAGSEDGLQDGC